MTTLSIEMLPMELCFESAQKRDPDFSRIAEESILAHLRAAGPASGEDCVDVAIAHGARAKDARAFGGVLHSLSRRGLIRCIRSDLPRKRGHGTSGGKLWGIVA